MIDSLVMRLNTLLESLVAEHKRLLALCKRQKDALVHVRTDELAALAQEVDSAVQRVHALERARLLCAAELAKQWGIPPAQVTVSELRNRLQGEALERLEQAASALRSVMLHLQRQVAENTRLAGQLERFVRTSFAWVAKAADDGYGNKLPAGARMPSVIVDVKA